MIGSDRGTITLQASGHLLKPDPQPVGRRRLFLVLGRVLVPPGVINAAEHDQETVGHKQT